MAFPVIWWLKPALFPLLGERQVGQLGKHPAPPPQADFEPRAPGGLMGSEGLVSPVGMASGQELTD